MISLSDENNTRAMHPVSPAQVPRPPKKCDGQFYTVRPTDTLFSIARKFSVTVDAILAANPQIVNPNIIFVGQVICIPEVAPKPNDVAELRVLTLRILSEDRQPLPVVDGAVQLNARVIVRATFNRPVFRAFFFLEPTGTETCELARLIGIDCPGERVAEILWQVPAGTLGRVFVVGCINSRCAKSEEILVVRNG
ncbi:LysM peptidoglycan-binding domain-containing protein [Dethiobacter alkaliphilus]|uniref:LysM peptidoglycan-binding domain-containing protein n=1 Tax=Dethiobacter alkaliphilus TaxID=427926 RepID=UPI0022260E4B|nr:LysM domain-containing protein [Dethiobacter alkaliphilus]MCW3489034.1 LysM peptidoglycan-binding domain-containing protein [Dethiobacter alkaliphilus]